MVNVLQFFLLISYNLLQLIFLLTIMKVTKKRQDTRKRVTQNHRSKGLIFKSMTAELPSY